MGFVYLHILILYSKYFDPMCVHHVNYKMHMITFWGCFWQTRIYHIYHEVSLCYKQTTVTFASLSCLLYAALQTNLNFDYSHISIWFCMTLVVHIYISRHPFDFVWYFLYISNRNKSTLNFNQNCHHLSTSSYIRRISQGRFNAKIKVWEYKGTSLLIVRALQDPAPRDLWPCT